MCTASAIWTSPTVRVVYWELTDRTLTLNQVTLHIIRTASRRKMALVRLYWNPKPMVGVEAVPTTVHKRLISTTQYAIMVALERGPGSWVSATVDFHLAVLSFMLALYPLVSLGNAVLGWPDSVVETGRLNAYGLRLPRGRASWYASSGIRRMAVRSVFSSSRRHRPHALRYVPVHRMRVLSTVHSPSVSTQTS